MLLWRYATKRFDKSKKIPPDKCSELLDSLRFAPSSFGLQPWKFVVVSDEKTKQELCQVAFGQSQVVDCSHLVVLCARTNLDADYVRRYTRSIADARRVPLDSLSLYEDIMIKAMGSMSDTERISWAQKQVYLALGFLLLSAAQMGIDACPMEGFDSKGVDKVLGLNDANLMSTVLCALGYRAEDDAYSSLKKVRFAESDLFKFV